MEKKISGISKYEVLKKEIERFPSVFIEGAACCGKTTMVRQYLNYLGASDADEQEYSRSEYSSVRSGYDTYYGNSYPYSDHGTDSSAENVTENVTENASENASDRQFKHSETRYGWFYRTLTWGVSDFNERLTDCLAWVSAGSDTEGRILILNYRINSSEIDAADEPLREICEVIRSMPEQNRVLIESREKPFPSVLDLIWHGEMGIISQNMLSLTEEEVGALIRSRESRINAREMMRLTGGWAGCVQMLITMEKTGNRPSAAIGSVPNAGRVGHVNPADLMQTYEIRYFIHTQILSTLTAEEQAVVRLIRRYGWATEEMLRFFVPRILAERGHSGWNMSSKEKKENAPGWNMSPGECAENLVRKGILYRYENSDKYHVREMFLLYENKPQTDEQMDSQTDPALSSDSGSALQPDARNRYRISGPSDMRKKYPVSEPTLAFWYEENGYLQEAADLFVNMPSAELEAFLIREYTQVQFLKIDLSFLLEMNLSGKNQKNRNSSDQYAEQDFMNDREITRHSAGNPEIIDQPELVYLRGIAALRSRNRSIFNECVEELKRTEGYRAAEMLINLTFADARTETADWFILVDEKAGKGTHFHLFHAKKAMDSCLYGVRELSDHFACSRREQNRYERLWQEFFGPDERKLYIFARSEYMAEAYQEEKISAEDWEIMAQCAEDEPERYSAIFLRILATCHDAAKILTVLTDERMSTLFGRCSRDSEQYLLVQLTGAVFADQIYSAWHAIDQELMRAGQESLISVDRVRWINENYTGIMKLDPEHFHYELFLLAKAFVFLKQYNRADRVLKKLDPVLNRLTFSRLHAEALFMNALVHREQGRAGLASQEVVESFAVSEPYRYAAFYTQYGTAGKKLMEEYLEWTKKNSGYRVHKKRYQYGNLLNLPHDEFVEFLIRKCRSDGKGTRTDGRAGGYTAGLNNSRTGGNITGLNNSRTGGNIPGLNNSRADRHTPDLNSGRENEAALSRSSDSVSYSADEMQGHLTMMELVILQDIREGLTNAEICAKENLKLPTVKSHLYNVYRKLGVNNRGQAVRAAVEKELLKS